MDTPTSRLVSIIQTNFCWTLKSYLPVLGCLRQNVPDLATAEANHEALLGVDLVLTKEVLQKSPEDLKRQDPVVRMKGVRRERWVGQATARGDGKNRGYCPSKAVEHYKHRRWITKYVVKLTFLLWSRVSSKQSCTVCGATSLPWTCFLNISA